MLGILIKHINEHRHRKKNAAEFHATSDDVFERISSRYDFLCDLFSIGLHRRWKNAVAREINKSDWKILLDGASGTGDIVLRTLSSDKSMQDRKIIAADLSPSMLKIAKKRICGNSDCANIEFEVMDAENMKSLEDCSVDCFSFSLAAKICNRNSVFDEAFRILKPGGTFVILEASTIPNRLVHFCYLQYMKLCMPVIGWIASGGDLSLIHI